MKPTRTWRVTCAQGIVTMAALGWVAGCDPATTDAAYWERAPAADATSGSTAETGGVGGGVASASVVASSSSGSAPVTCASIAFTTVSYDGHYEPRNVGAAWIVDGSGTFVRTLERWGQRRLKNAVAWRESSGGDEVDAITGATKHDHGPHALTWDCRDASGGLRDAGAFEVHLEFTEENSAENDPPGPHRVIPIDLASPGPLDTPDDAAFIGVSVVVRP